MEQNIVVVLIDEEISRLRQVRAILQSLTVMQAEVAPLLEAAAEDSGAEELEESGEPPEPPALQESVVRHVSRRGIKTGQRGPRPRQGSAPRPLDAAVPQAPVVVSRASLAPKPAAAPEPVVEATLESWVRSFRQSRPTA